MAQILHFLTYEMALARLQFETESLQNMADVLEMSFESLRENQNVI